MAEAFWVADTRTDGELGAYLRWRCDLVTALIRDIRAAVRADATVAVIPSVARPTGGAWDKEGSTCARWPKPRERSRRAFTKQVPAASLPMPGTSAAGCAAPERCGAFCGRRIPIWAAAMR